MLLVTGVSGVGKTFTITSAKIRDPSVVRFSGSSILREMGRPISDLTISAVRANQFAIARYLATIDEEERRFCILDGHAVIETANGPWPVPVSIIRTMGIRVVTVVVDEIPDLALRRASKGKPSEPNAVSSLQEVEIAHSLVIAVRIGVPLTFVRSGDGENLLRHLKMPGYGEFH